MCGDSCGRREVLGKQQLGPARRWHGTEPADAGECCWAEQRGGAGGRRGNVHLCIDEWWGSEVLGPKPVRPAGMALAIAGISLLVLALSMGTNYLLLKAFGFPLGWSGRLNI